MTKKIFIVLIIGIIIVVSFLINVYDKVEIFVRHIK